MNINVKFIATPYSRCLMLVLSGQEDYAGVLAGPAPIGFVAHAISLNMAFAGLGITMLLVAASARLKLFSGKAV